MLKFAVVHYQPGPNWDFGLDYHSPETPGEPVTIEDTVFSLVQGPDRVLPSKFEQWTDKYDQFVGGIEKKDPKKEKVVVKPSPKRLACMTMDYDSTMAANPRDLQSLVNRAAMAGCSVHLVTSMAEPWRPMVERFCKIYSIKFSSMSFCPVRKSSNTAGWDAMMDDRIGDWKAGRIAGIGADIVVENNFIHINRIAKRLPKVITLRVVGE